MDYEVFLSESQSLLKELKDKTAIQAKAVNNIDKCIANGDLNALPKLYSTLKDAADGRELALIELEKHTSAFDGNEYMTNGEFTSQLIDSCNQLQVDVQGTFPIYDMFPCRITINAESQDVLIDKKRHSCLRPNKLSVIIKTELDKLSKASFNAQAFAKELAAAYDIAILKASKKKTTASNAPIYAQELYNILTPMRRYKKEYTVNNFAFDLARLYAADPITLDDGRSLRFDTVRDMKKSIRILDSHGFEQFVTTIRFA